MEVAAAVIVIVILVSSMVSLCLWLLQSMRDMPKDDLRDVVAPACVAYVLILGISLTLAWAVRQDTDLWTTDFRYGLDAFLVAAMVLFSCIFVPLVLIQVTCPVEDPDARSDPGSPNANANASGSLTHHPEEPDTRHEHENEGSMNA